MLRNWTTFVIGSKSKPISMLIGCLCFIAVGSSWLAKFAAIWLVWRGRGFLIGQISRDSVFLLHNERVSKCHRQNFLKKIVSTRLGYHRNRWRWSHNWLLQPIWERYMYAARKTTPPRLQSMTKAPDGSGCRVSRTQNKPVEQNTCTKASVPSSPIVNDVLFV